MKDIKQNIADLLFGAELDKAYQLGVQEGATFAARKISMTVIEAGENEKLTKTQKIGYEVARAAIREAKLVIMRMTGALL